MYVTITTEFVNKLGEIMNTSRNPLGMAAESTLVRIMEYYPDQRIKNVAYDILNDSNLELCSDTIRMINSFLPSRRPLG